MGSLMFVYLSFCLKFYVVLSHGYLKDPPSRSSTWRLPQFINNPKNYNDNQLFCGGKEHQWKTNGGKCGMCGDPYDSENRENEAGGKYATGIISKCYNQSQSTISVTVKITANHKGYFEFRLCENNDPSVRITQSCLDQHLLTLADGSGTRYYIGDDLGDYTVNLNLPSIICSQCVLQWKYNTGNSWGCSNSSHCGLGLGSGHEQFYGCSDIAIDTNCKTFDLYQFTKSSTTQSTTTKKLSIHTTSKSKDGFSTTQSSSNSFKSSSTRKSTTHSATTPISSKSSIISLASSSKPSTSLPVSSTTSAIPSSSSHTSPTSSSISSTSPRMSSTSLPVSSTPSATLSKSSSLSSTSSSISSKSSLISSTSVLTTSSLKSSFSSTTSTQSTSTLNTYTNCVAKMEYSNIEAVKESCNVSCAKGYCLVYYCNCGINHSSSTSATTIQQRSTLKRLLLSSSLSSTTTPVTYITKSVSPTTTTPVPTTSTTTPSSTSNSCANVKVYDTYKDTPGMLGWCIVHCKIGQCPKTHCICS